MIGSNIIQFGYVDDLVEGIIYSFDNENFFNEDFNISGERRTYNRKIYRYLWRNC